MLVSWRSKGALTISISKDGIIWSDLKIILNKGKKESWESIVNRACLIKFYNKYYLYYKINVLYFLPQDKIEEKVILV